MKKFIVLLLAIFLITGTVFAADTQTLEKQVDQLTKRIEQLESMLAGQRPAPQPAPQPMHRPAPPQPPMPVVYEYAYPDMRAIERMLDCSFCGNCFNDFMYYPTWEIQLQNLFDYAEAIEQQAAAQTAVNAEIDLSTVELQQGDFLKLDISWKDEHQSGKQSFASSITDIAKKTYNFSLSFDNVPGTLEVSVIRGNKVIASASASLAELAGGSACKVVVTPAK